MGVCGRVRSASIGERWSDGWASHESGVADGGPLRESGFGVIMGQFEITDLVHEETAFDFL
jgi:hypothetical protein